ncbi:MAG: glycosyltransferase family 2 protein, partial [Porphyromonas sp.]
MRYSFVIPVYNRPDEVRELLESLTHQELFDFEIVIIEDGSSVSSEAIVESYRGSFPALRYIAVPNGGPSRARNLGAREATGEYLIIL